MGTVINAGAPAVGVPEIETTGSGAARGPRTRVTETSFLTKTRPGPRRTVLCRRPRGSSSTYRGSGAKRGDFMGPCAPAANLEAT